MLELLIETLEEELIGKLLAVDVSTIAVLFEKQAGDGYKFAARAPKPELFKDAHKFCEMAERMAHLITQPVFDLSSYGEDAYTRYITQQVLRHAEDLGIGLFIYGERFDSKIHSVLGYRHYNGSREACKHVRTNIALGALGSLILQQQSWPAYHPECFRSCSHEQPMFSNM